MAAKEELGFTFTLDWIANYQHPWFMKVDAKTGTADSSADEFECAVCLQTCIHPVRLPCSHIFCYLCVKGSSKRCAMCRQEIPGDFIEHPTLLHSLEAEKTEVAPGEYQWFYEGRNGWWQYDERTSTELEAAFSEGQRLCEVLVAGFLYVIDFDRMLQLRRNEPNRRRRIKRDLSSIPRKGIAGIKHPGQLQREAELLHTAPLVAEESSVSAGHSDLNSRLLRTASAPMIGGGGSSDLCPPTPTAPSNTPQTPHTPSAASSSNGSPETTENYLHSLMSRHGQTLFPVGDVTVSTSHSLSPTRGEIRILSSFPSRNPSIETTRLHPGPETSVAVVLESISSQMGRLTISTLPNGLPCLPVEDDVEQYHLSSSDENDED